LERMISVHMKASNDHFEREKASRTFRSKAVKGLSDHGMVDEKRNAKQREIESDLKEWKFVENMSEDDTNFEAMKLE
jgi:hypothetical protein